MHISLMLLFKKKVEYSKAFYILFDNALMLVGWCFEIESNTRCIQILNLGDSGLIRDTDIFH